MNEEEEVYKLGIRTIKILGYEDNLVIIADTKNGFQRLLY